MWRLAAVFLVILSGCGGASFVAGPAGDAEDDGLSTHVVEAGPVDSGAVDGGVADADADVEAAAPCVTDLSGVGTGDFQIAFTLTTTAAESVDIVNQRSTCATSTEWDVYTTPGGGIEFETDDGIAADRVFTIGGPALNDGKLHRVSVGRTDGKIWVQAGQGSELIADPYAFGAFPPLMIGTDPCGATAAPLGSGSVTDLCITK